MIRREKAKSSTMTISHSLHKLCKPRWLLEQRHNWKHLGRQLRYRVKALSFRISTVNTLTLMTRIGPGPSSLLLGHSPPNFDRLSKAKVQSIRMTFSVRYGRYAWKRCSRHGQVVSGLVLVRRTGRALTVSLAKRNMNMRAEWVSSNR